MDAQDSLGWMYFYLPPPKYHFRINGVTSKSELDIEKSAKDAVKDAIVQVGINWTGECSSLTTSKQ